MQRNINQVGKASFDKPDNSFPNQNVDRKPIKKTYLEKLPCELNRYEDNQTAPKTSQATIQPPISNFVLPESEVYIRAKGIASFEHGAIHIKQSVSEKDIRLSLCNQKSQDPISKVSNVVFDCSFKTDRFAWISHLISYRVSFHTIDILEKEQFDLSSLKILFDQQFDIHTKTMGLSLGERLKLKHALSVLS